MIEIDTFPTVESGVECPAEAFEFPGCIDDLALDRSRPISIAGRVCTGSSHIDRFATAC